jgi:hypothetical protein
MKLLIVSLKNCLLIPSEGVSRSRELIIGEELSEVQFAHLFVMGFECLPNRA